MKHLIIALFLVLFTTSIRALEADGGAFTTRMFTINAGEETVGRVAAFLP